jgi:hypothetical protein
MTIQRLLGASGWRPSLIRGKRLEGVTGGPIYRA